MSSPYVPARVAGLSYPPVEAAEGDYESRIYQKIFRVLAALIVLTLLSVWWWSRGADVRLQVSPAGSVVTFDGQPLTVNNGEAVLTSVSRGGHVLTVTSPDGTSVARVMDVGFFATTQSESVTAPPPLIAMHQAATKTARRRR
jgi:hypothetical protein